MNAEGTSCYLHKVPEFVEQELAARYETLHSSLPFFRVWRTLGNASCYIDRGAGRAPHILLFHCERQRLVVLNEMIEVAPAGVGGGGGWSGLRAMCSNTCRRSR